MCPQQEQLPDRPLQVHIQARGQGKNIAMRVSRTLLDSSLRPAITHVTNRPLTDCPSEIFLALFW